MAKLVYDYGKIFIQENDTSELKINHEEGKNVINKDKDGKYIIDPSFSKGEQIANFIKMIEPYLQTTSQIKNIRFLKIFNKMFILLDTMLKEKQLSEYLSKNYPDIFNSLYNAKISAEDSMYE